MGREYSTDVGTEKNIHMKIKGIGCGLILSGSKDRVHKRR
jgi:hypothetical protein